MPEIFSLGRKIDEFTTLTMMVGERDDGVALTLGIAAVPAPAPAEAPAPKP